MNRKPSNRGGGLKLAASGINVRFGGLAALRDVSMDVAEGEIVGLIGANGAGKSTLINVLSGFQPALGGSVTFNARPLLGLAPDAIARSGIVRTFQAVRLFGGLTVVDNVAAAAAIRGVDRARVKSLIEVMGLTGLERQTAGTLSYANQRRVAIARALALRPRILLLDEPAAGMTPDEIADIDSTLVSLRDRTGIGLLLVEHNMALVMGVCERIVVLDSGSVIAEGKPEEVQRDAAVRAAYLGAS